MPPDRRPPTDIEYQQLLEFRDRLRSFLRWSEARARSVGLSPAHHQLLLAIRGHRGGSPTISDVAEHLLIRHHSAVGAVDRAVAAGLVERHADPDDRRIVRLSLTERGAALLAGLTLTHQHLQELARLRDHLEPLLGTGEASDRRVTGD